MPAARQITLGIVAGEQSGENLAVDLVDTLAAETGMAPKLVGVGGGRLAERGLESVFDASEISITGASAVVASLPRILWRIRQTANAIIAQSPDVLVLIDSPDFSHRVARRVKRALPQMPIFKYVAPSVWAWRPGRAAKMTAYVDHVLAILPFEPDVMKKLGGPPTHYVGHPLAMDEDLALLWKERLRRPARSVNEAVEVLVLPGSRSGELDALLPDFGEAIEVLHERGRNLRVSMPTLLRLEERLRRDTVSWRAAPLITTSRTDKLNAFRRADVALAASGTVLFELALAGIPSISCYKADPLMKLATSMITIWSAALPNIVTDMPIVPEYINEMIRPGMLARQIEVLSEPGSKAAEVQIDGFARMRELMSVDKKPGTRAAEIILDVIGKSKA
jgi:lipid-A-disaccharide synthase